LRYEIASASKIFSTMAVFNILRAQIERVSWRMTLVIQGACELRRLFCPPVNFNIFTTAKVSFDRLDKFLTNTPLLDLFSGSVMQHDLTYGQPPDEVANAGQELKIGFKDASFSWTCNKDAHAPPESLSGQFRLCIKGELVFVKHGINIISGPT
jgi:hypothetical protein